MQTAAESQRLLDSAFDEFDVADLLESHSELVINLTETIGGLEQALETRGVIGQALGICRERYGLTAEQAFQFLTRLSQNHNIKLRDVAAHLVRQPCGRAPSRRANGDPADDDSARRGFED